MASFEQLLNSYFTTVKVVHASEYNQSMSADFDVTIIDETTIYDGIIVSGQAVKGNGKGDIRCKVSYQSCDKNICFPPTEKEVIVKRQNCL